LAFRIARAGRIGRDITAMATLLIVIVELIFRLGLPLIFKTMQIAALLIAITVPVHLLCWAVVRIGDAVYGKPVS
jgi:hypothetical protein